jgi:tRNA(Ile)-lysidine synthase
MQTLFNHVLVKQARVEPGDRILVALSGGADSVVMLDLLLKAAEALKVEVRAAHLDHGMRAESANDAHFVQDFCLQRKVSLNVDRRDIPGLALARKQGMEEAARDERRAFLQDTARLFGCNLIALGHHRDDQAETFLHRLLRGSGLSGLAGMRLRTDPFIRPLLPFSRTQILQYLADHRLPHVEDLSNADTTFTRNRLRHDLLPHLRKFNPRIDEHLARLSQRIALEEEYWDLQVSMQLDSLCEEHDDGLWLPREELRNLHPALRARVLRAALERLRGDLRGIGAQHLGALEDLLAGPRPEAEVHLPGAWVARRYQKLWMRTEAPRVAGSFAVAVPGPGVYDLPGGGRLLVSLEDGCAGEDVWSVEFDAASVAFPLLVRSFVPGDRFYPSGAPGHRKLKDFFIDIKLERELRRAWPLVVADEILWLPGLRRCHGRHPQQAGGQVLRLVVSGMHRGNQSL